MSMSCTAPERSPWSVYVDGVMDVNNTHEVTFGE